MALYEGERIKIFPDTDVNQYCRFIRKQGFSFKKEGEFLIVLRKNSRLEYDKETFAEILIHRMKIKGFTREKLAEEIGVTQQAIFYWEKGKIMPSKFSLEMMMPVLDITERDLEKCRI